MSTLAGAGGGSAGLSSGVLSLVFDVLIEACLSEKLVELLVEDVAGGLGEIGGGDKEVCLLLGWPTTHGHGQSPHSDELLGVPQHTMPVKGLFNRLLAAAA